ncbi:MAG TPA: uroporphyrinogen-III synthase [Polyangia bacterium]|jgi:uroporphyrinogen-III synthase|nr:uroporphyrinogen-III synthase [Polyangia bacterium]
MIAGPPPLAGRTVALPESRELNQLSRLLEEQGATALRCPLVSILDAPDPAPVDAWLQRLTAGAFDDVIFLTGEGLRRLLARAARTGTRDAVVAALGRVRRITRGPKPARALHEIGLASDLPAPVPTSRGVIDSVSQLDLGGRRVGLQLYGTDPGAELVAFLQGAGASVDAVAPYIYAPAIDDQRARDLIAAMDDGRVDAIAFTSASQVERLWQVARTAGSEAALSAALARTRVAAIGPIVDAVLRERGVRVDILTDKPFVMKHLVGLIAEKLGPG